MERINFNKELAHIKKRKALYWGKDEYMYRFYEAQEVLVRTWKIKHEKN
jgi:hypothetical protein